jgi:hypothetical protein
MSRMPRRWDGNEQMVIRVLKEAFKRGKSRDRFSLYRTGMTVEAYVSACKKTDSPQYALNDITWDLEHGFIDLLPPGTKLS